MKSKIEQLREWEQTTFLPWQKAALEAKNEELQSVRKLQKHANELKTIVSLLLENKEAQALKIWNDLGLDPKLRGIRVNLVQDSVSLLPEEGEVQTLNLDDLLADLQVILNQR